MPALPDLPAAIGLARYAVVAYAAGVTIATTVCLVLHVVTRLDRRTLRRARTIRPLFVPLETTPSPNPPG